MQNFKQISLGERVEFQLKNFFLIGCLLGTLSILSGCGTMGATDVQSIDIKPQGTLVATLETGSLELAENATRLDSVGVFPWGEFSQDDLGSLRQSLRNSLATMQKSSVVTSGKKLSVHVLLRRYLVATSNNSVGVLANTAWCAVDEAGKIVFHEQFYSSNSIVLLGTIGGAKNKVNEAILSRISSVSAHLASTNGFTTSPPPMPANAFIEFDRAVQKLPSRFRSIHFVSGGGYTHVAESGKLANWNWASTPERINWEDRLKGATK